MAELEEKTPQEHFNSKIWRILDIFRGENVIVDDYYVALLFLSLERTKSLPVANNFSNKEFYKHLSRSIKEIGGEISKIFSPVIPHFEASIKKLSHHGLNDLIFEIHGLINENQSDDFSEVFDHVLYRISGAQGRHGGEIVQPVELTKFLMNLADLPANAKIFNPFAGLASFGVFLNKGQHYYGQELNQKTWAIGQLRLYAHGRTESSSFVSEDSTENWPEINESFDLLISHPPFLSFNVARLNNQSPKVAIKTKSFEHFLIDQGIQLLKGKGKLIAVLSQGFLFRGSTEGRLREQLVNEDLIDTIISLPGGLLSNTNIPLVVLVINLNKNHPDLIRFIDGYNFVESKSRKEKLLDYISLSLLAQGPYEDSKNVKIISIEQIRENNYNLHITRYFQKRIEGIKLKDLLEPIGGKYANTGAYGKLVKIRDLKDDKINFNLENSRIEIAELKGLQVKKIEESCLLLATRWKTLKPTWYEYENAPIYLRSGDVLPFRIKEDLADKAFLISELHSYYVQEQLELYRVGTIIPFIRKEDLLEVVVKIPSIGKQNSLDLQKAKFQGIYEETKEWKEKESGFDKKFAEVIENQVRDFQSLKHTIRQYLSPLKSNVSGTRKFLQKNEGKAISLDMIYSKNLGQTLNQHLFSIEDIIDSINKLLLRNEQKPLNTGSSDLIELIQNCQRKFKQEDIFFFTEPEIDEESLKDNEENTIKPILGLSEDQFEALFSNVIDNAVKHGFKEKKPGFMVKVSIGYDNGFIKMIISNNGAPLAEGFSKKHLTTLGEKTTDSNGTGTGGADIKKIVDLAGGSFDIIGHPNADLLRVSYIFEFPLIIEE